MLNRARKVLERLEDAAWRRSLDHHDPYAPVTAWDLGRLSDAASAADDAIFRVLNTARTNCKVKMTEAQLFGTDTARAPALEAEAPVVPTPPPVRSLLGHPLPARPAAAGPAGLGVAPHSSGMSAGLRSVSRRSSSQ